MILQETDLGVLRFYIDLIDGTDIDPADLTDAQINEMYSVHRSHIDLNALALYVYNVGSPDWFEDAFCGKFDSREKFIDNYVKEVLGISVGNIYIDYDKMWYRGLAVSHYTLGDDNQYYFKHL